MKIENRNYICWLRGEDLVFAWKGDTISLYALNLEGWELIQIVSMREKDSDIPKNVAIFKFIG